MSPVIPVPPVPPVGPAGCTSKFSAIAKYPNNLPKFGKDHPSYWIVLQDLELKATCSKQKKSDSPVSPVKPVAPVLPVTPVKPVNPGTHFGCQ